jgi:hypothetical protein
VFKISFAAVPGRSKPKVPGACQDAAGGRQVGDTACIVLADGAGSKLNSGTGARVCVQLISEILVRHFDSLYLGRSPIDDATAEHFLICSILDGIGRKRFAARDGVDSYACTLLFVAHKNGKSLVGHLGDGIVFMKASGAISVASHPENGEFINQTVFVTSKSAETSLKLQRIETEGPCTFLLSSDGPSSSLIKKNSKEVASAVGTLIGWAESNTAKKMTAILNDNLRSIFSLRTTDDCSIAVLNVPLQKGSS